jgi:hypothetical protein
MGNTLFGSDAERLLLRDAVNAAAAATQRFHPDGNNLPIRVDPR